MKDETWQNWQRSMERSPQRTFASILLCGAAVGWVVFGMLITLIATPVPFWPYMVGGFVFLIAGVLMKAEGRL